VRDTETGVHVCVLCMHAHACSHAPQVTTGLHVLHVRNFVHLDIKPENIYGACVRVCSMLL
jgi:hypothetical protein